MNGIPKSYAGVLAVPTQGCGYLPGNHGEGISFRLCQAPYGALNLKSRLAPYINQIRMMPESSALTLRHAYRTSRNHESARRLVLLHGSGSNENDLFNFCLSYLNVDFNVLSLRAPSKSTNENGYQWYEVGGDSNQYDCRLLKEDLLGMSAEIALEKTVLLGFSQGAAIAYKAAIDLPLAGLCICSGYPLDEVKTPQKMPPTLFIHGIHDEIVPFDKGLELFERSRSRENVALLSRFKGGHYIDLSQVSIIQSYLHWCFALHAPN